MKSPVTPPLGFFARYRHALRFRAEAVESNLRRSRRATVEPLEARIAPAAIITATTVKTFFVDADGDGKADPGLDTIQYVVTIGNTGDANATNVSYNDNLDPNTTLSGAVLRSPLAVAQSYLAAGNTVLSVAAGSGLKTNVHDLDGVTPDASLVVATGTFATGDGGSVVIAADGSFTYTPKTGDQNLTDTFTYSVTDSSGLTGTGRASISLGARVWYVDSAFGGTSDGSSAKPYKALSDISGASGSDATGDIIFIKNSSAYNGNLTLLNNEHLYGSGATLTVNGVTINTAGSNTSLTTTTAATDTLTLASGNDIHGFTLGNSAAGATGAAITGTSFGTFTVENTGTDHTTINTTGVALNLNTGTLAGTGFTSITGKSVSLTTIGGTAHLGSGALSTTTGDAFFVSGGAASIDYSGTITEGVAGTGHSVNIASKTGGTVALSGAISDSGTGLVLSSTSSTTISLTGGVVASTGVNKAFTASGATTTINVTGANNTLTTTTATALDLANVTLGASGMTFKSINTNGAANGISLVSLGGGSLTVTGDGTGFANGSGGSISNALTEAVHLLSNSGTITFNSMNFGMNTSAIDGILVDNNAGGTITVNVIGCTFTGVTASVSQNKSLLQYEAGGAANVTANVQHSFFNGSRTYGFFATGAGTSTLNVTVNQSGFGTNVVSGAAVNQPGTTITNPPAFGLGVTNGSSALVDYTITNNTFWGADGNLGAIYAVTISGASTTAAAHLNGSFNFNKIGKTGVTGSGAANGAGALGLLPGTSGAFQATVIGNDIRQVNAVGVNFFNSAGGGASIAATLKIKGNTFAEPDTTGSPLFLRAIVVTPGNSGGANNPWIAEIGDTTGTVPANRNIISDGGTAPSGPNTWQTGNYIRVTNNNNTPALVLPGLSPASGATKAQVDAFVQGANTLPASSVNSTLGASGINGGAPLPLMFAPTVDNSATPPVVGVPIVPVTPPPVIDGTAVTPPVVPPVIVDDGILSQAELDSLVGAAIARWEATGLTPAQDALLHSVQFSVEDLPGWFLGEATPGHVIVDSNAAGNRWFIDSTPNDDSEYSGTGTKLSAPVGVASGRVDALTTVIHELGHQLGLDDTYATADSSNLMYGYMHLGERRLPAAHQAEGADPHHLATNAGPDFAIGPVSIGTLNPGSSVQVQYRATVNSPFPASGTPTITDQGTVSFDPSQTVQPTAVTTQVDLPQVSLAVSAPVLENSGTDLTYTFTRTGDTSVPLTVGFAASGTATFVTTGQDYTIPDAATFSTTTGLGTVVFAGGSATATVHVHVTGDTLNEPDETAILTVSSGQNGYNPSSTLPIAATGTIQNDDPVPTVSINSISLPEGNTGTTPATSFTFNVSLNTASGQTVTVHYATANGTATAPSDFTAIGDTVLTFNPGVTSLPVTVLVNGDTTSEGDEQFTVNLSTASNATILNGTGTGTIQEDDTAVSVTIGTTPVLESSATGLIYTFARTGATTAALPINFTKGGTATNTTDYTATSNAVSLGGAFDYTNGTLTIPAGSSSVTVTLTPTDDRQVEGDETGILTVASGAGYGVSGSPATGTITDNDTATIGFTLGTSTALESAGTQNVNATLTINAIGTGTIGLASNLTANLTTTGGTATGGGTDYTLPASPALTFLAGTYATGTATQNAAVTVIDDRLVEGDETAQFGLSIATNIGTQVSLGGTTAHTLTLTDNDTATLGFTSGTSAALESVGTQNVSATLTINAIGTGTIGLATNLTANLTSTGGTATGSGTDYTLPASPAVTFLAGTYATGTATQLAAVTVIDDRQVEGDETAQFGLSIAGNIGTQASIGGTTSHTLTITDNDTATLGFTTGTSTALESVGTQNISATLTINAIGTGTIGLASNLTANLTTTGGTATGSGTDYTLPGSPAVTFLAGTYATGTATQNGAVNVIDDRQVEGSETAQFGLSIAGNIGTQVSLGGTTAHTLTITDNDTATLGFTLGTSTALESVGTQNVNATLTINAIGTGTIGLASNLTANLTTTGGTATGSGTDYTLPASPALTFLAGTYATGTATQNAAVTVIDDRLVEGDETAQFGLSIVTNIGTQVSLGGTTAHTLTLTDNDTATLGFSLGTSTALESVGTQNVATVLTINAIGTGTIGLASNLTANLTTTGGTATGSGTDYTLPGSPAVTFLAGTYATGTATQNGAITVIDDRQVEGDETAALGLSIATNIGTQVSLGGTTAHTLTITDNDTATLGFTAGTSSALESVGTQNVSTTLTINAIGTGTIGLASNLTANLTTTGGTATGSGTDYILPGSPAVTFLAGTYATGAATQNGAVTITDDRLVEGSETAALGLSIVTNIGTQVSLGGTTAHTLTITDNDTATLGFTAGTSTALESVGTQNVSTTLTINAIGTGTIGLASNLTANLTTTGGTATGSGTDYTLPGSPAVTFLAGTYATGTATQNGAVTVIDDRLVEGSETALLGLSIQTNIGTQVSLGGTTAHTLTITDNDTATVALSAPAVTAAEGGGTSAALLTLTLNTIGTGPAQLASAVTVNLTDLATGSATGSGTDYTFTNPTAVTFAASSTSGATATASFVSINDDTVVEGTETVNLSAAIFSGPATISGSNLITANILDNDMATVTIAKIADAAEGGANGKFRITQTLASASNTVVNYSIGGTSSSGADFTALSGTATIIAGQMTVDIDVAVINDTLIEGTESVSAQLTTFGAHDPAVTFGANTSASLNITDNDTASISLVPTLGVTESGGSQNVTVTLTTTANGVAGTGTLATTLTADVVDLVSGTATSGSDYSAFGTQTVTFAANSGNGAAQTVGLAVLNDSILENNETVNLKLQNLNTTLNGQVGFGTVNNVATIADNETATLAIAPTANFTEQGGAQHVSVTLTITGDAGGTAQLGAGVTVTGDVVDAGGGSATSGSDYTAFGTQTVTFPGGTSTGATQDAILTLSNDTLIEGTESVNLKLQNLVPTLGGRVTLGNTATAVTITDNDTATVSFAAATSNAPEATTPHLVGVTLVTTANGVVGTGTLAHAVSVTATDSGGGSATAGGTDYTFNQQTVTFGIGAGDSTQNISAAIVNDAISEGDETFNLSLGSFLDGTGGQTSLVAPTAHAVTIVDNDVDLQVTKTESIATVVAGSGAGNLVYTVTVKNTGLVDATGVVVNEDLTLPAGVTISTIVPSNGSFTPTVAPDGHWTLDLPKGASETLTVTLTADHSAAAGTDVIGDTASVVSANEQLVNTGDDSATENTSVARQSAVSISKTGTPQLVLRGKHITYTITVSNTGPSDVTGATVMDAFPAGLTGVTFTTTQTGGANGNSAGAGNINQMVNLPAGSTITYTVDASAPLNPAGPTISNTATVSAPGDTTTGDDSATATTSIYQGIYVTSPGIAVGKNFSPPKIRVFNPSTGVELDSFLAYEPTYKDSIRVAVGDMNNDGFDDVITTTGKGTGRLRVFLFDPATATFAQPTSGAFMNEIAVFDGKKDKGAYVAAGDLNGDGQDDIVIGSALGGGKVKVIDGLTGTPVTFASTSTDFFQPFGKAFRGGIRVASGDTNNDGKDELVVGMGYLGAQVNVYAGKTDLTTINQGTPQTLTIKNGTRAYRGGVSVALGDLDHDGKADLIIGRNSGKPSQIETFKGTDLSVLGGSPILPFDVNPAKPKYTNGVRVAAVDVNFDGVADIIAGAGGKAGSLVNIYDGVTHALLRSAVAYPDFLNEAIFVAGSSPVPN